MARQLIVIYGPPLAGKSTVSWQVARSLEGKTAVVSADQLLGGSIATADNDWEAELEMVHTQIRLLVANYLKNAYHVVVEAPYIYERAGRLHNYEAEVDQLLSLMRNLTSDALMVRLRASETALAERASESGRDGELDLAKRINEAYRGRYGLRFVAIDTDGQALASVADSIRGVLRSGVA